MFLGIGLLMPGGAKPYRTLTQVSPAPPAPRDCICGFSGIVVSCSGSAAYSSIYPVNVRGAAEVALPPAGLSDR